MSIDELIQRIQKRFDARDKFSVFLMDVVMVTEWNQLRDHIRRLESANQQLEERVYWQEYVCETCNEVIPRGKLVEPLNSACPRCGTICFPKHILALKEKDKQISDLQQQVRRLEEVIDSAAKDAHDLDIMISDNMKGVKP